MPFTITMLYHPTIAVDDLEAARGWFRDVFGRRPLRWEETLDLDLLDPEYPKNYSFFAFIADEHWVFLCPTLHATGKLAGQTRYKGVPEGMIGLGWSTDDAVDVFAELADRGIGAIDQQGQLITTAAKPVSSFADDILTGFTLPEDTGFRYEFQQTSPRHWPKYAEFADPRLGDDWSGPKLDPADPLGILRTSHHTILTLDLDRALGFYRDALGAVVLDSTRNVELGAESTFVRLADTTLEFAVPDDPAPWAERLSDGRDFYQGVTFEVADPDKAFRHLEEVGVAPVRLSDEVVSIQPEHGFGAEWRFVRKSATEADES
ncbi:VOC family protein [Frondihabitans cladoniiphilus]|uniref:VOC domain-containing protein n=1 Tax=Frondihabitans cladoniiphilus TaxID=715785 RepID=A0ABP8WC86_9MICO